MRSENDLPTLGRYNRRRLSFCQGESRPRLWPRPRRLPALRCGASLRRPCPILHPPPLGRRVFSVSTRLGVRVRACVFISPGFAFTLWARGVVPLMCAVCPMGLALPRFRITIFVVGILGTRDVPTAPDGVWRGVLDDELPAVQEMILLVDQRARRVLRAREVDERPPAVRRAVSAI